MRFYLAKILVVVLVFTGYFLFLQITTPHNGGILIYQAQAQTNGLVPCGRNPNNPDNPPETTRPCTPCDFFQLVSNVFNFLIFYFVPAVATLFFLIAGFLILLGGASPKQIATGKSIFQTTAIGVAVIFGAWMITNTVLKSLAGNSDYSTHWYSIQCTNPVQVAPPSTQLYTCSSENKCVVAPSSATGKTYTTSNCDNTCQVTGGVLRITTTTLPDAIVGQSYNNFITVSGGMPSYTFSTTGSLPAGLNLNEDGAINGVPTAEGSATFSVEVTDLSMPQQSVTGDVKITVKTQGAASSIPAGCFDVDANGVINEQDCGAPENDQCSACNLAQAAPNEIPAPIPSGATTSGVVCPQSNLNLCQAASTSCSTNVCGTYSSAIAAAASSISISGVNTQALVRSILFNESSCNVSSVNQQSCGLMQMQPGTAKIFAQYCGVDPGQINCNWLTNSQNAAASVCLGAKFIESLANGSCGNNARHIAAGYNGGQTACEYSNSCSNDTDCVGDTPAKWECLYDDTNHTVCNTGYDETRTYVTRVTDCYNKNSF